MQDATAAPDARHLEMIGAMTECAFALAQAASEIGTRAGDDNDLFFKACETFNRCCFSMRMGIRLSQLIRAGVKPAAPAARPEPEETALERPEAADDVERPDWNERLERERDRDYEPVSLPRFLKSLGLIAADAERRRDELPPHIRDTTLPTLQALLREANGPPDGAAASAVAVLARPPVAPAARSRLLTSTVTLDLPPLPPGRRPSG